MSEKIRPIFLREIGWTGVQVFFADLLNRCREEVRLRILSGQASERGLARRTGISQPHLHNVLKGARPMSPDVADRLMRRLGVSMDELLAARTRTAAALHTEAREIVNRNER